MSLEDAREENRALAKGLQQVPSAQRTIMSRASWICPKNGLWGRL